VHGEDGSDTLVGGAGDDQVIGGAGNDVMDGGTGADDIDGGVDRDTARYASRSGGVNVTIDANPNDGSSSDLSNGRRDNVQTTVEGIIGGKGADRLTGSSVGNQITGGPGSDDIFGLGGPDVISVNGDGTADEVDCGIGTDTVHHDAGLDVFPTSGTGACENTSP
jgi:Ca2+-binding RTX toxin-like protein